MKATLVPLAAIAILACAPRAEAQWQAPYGQPAQPYPQPAQPYPQPYAQRTEQQLDQARRDDAGRRLEFVWVDVHGGFEQLGMTLFGGERDLTGGFISTSSSGGVVGMGIGARLLYFTLLVRGRIGFFDSGQLYRIGAEAGLHVPLGRLEPWAALGVGYAAVGGLRDNVNGAVSSQVGLTGGYARFAAGADYFLTPIFSLGLGASAELLGLHRAALSTAAIQAIQSSVLVERRGSAAVFAQSATGWGGTFALTGVAGLHF